MNNTLNQLEDRLNELESMKRQRQSWLNELVAPMAERLQYLTQMRRDHAANANSNIIQFPLERISK